MTRLLDVNLLMALLWHDHEHHERAGRWLATVSQFATCPIVQLGFVRISSQPAVSYCLRPEQAFSILRRWLSDSRHRFTPDDLNCDERALLTERVPGPNQVTDYYLAALARRHGMVLATFDTTLSRTFSNGTDSVELVP